MTAQQVSSSSATMMSGGFTPDKSLLSILDYMENLCQVYSEEQDALELRDMKRFSDIQYLKVGLINECEQRIHDIELQKDLMRTVNSALKDRVITTQERLNKLAMESARCCKIRAESTKRIQERLLDAARHMVNQDQKRYNKDGKNFASSQNRPEATSINEAI